MRNDIEEIRDSSGGEAITWLIGGSLALCLFMVVGFLVLICYHGLGAFWPQSIQLVNTRNTPRCLIGELQAVSGSDALFRTNADSTGQSFQWVSDWVGQQDTRTLDDRFCCVERKNGTRIFGVQLPEDASEPDESIGIWVVSEAAPIFLAAVDSQDLLRQLLSQKNTTVGSVAKRFPNLAPLLGAEENEAELVMEALGNSQTVLIQRKSALRQPAASICWAATDPSGIYVQELGSVSIPRSNVRSLSEPNGLGFLGKLQLYLDRWARFLFSTSSTADQTTGILSSLVGTALLTLVMLVIVIPLGLMAALYLHEYTQGGWMVSLIRASVTNLAGVPSIVFGVFGLSFFCYTVGAFIDGGPANAQLSTLGGGVWLGSTILLLVGSCVGFGLFLFRNVGTSQRSSLTRFALFLWLFCTSLMILLLFRCPFFGGIYASQLPNPTFGKGGLIWSALTLSLLTLPTMIVSCEEAFSQVPRSLRNGSLACGATKWQTILRVVIPYARRGIITGAILCMARGTAAVAPLILVGALPYVRDWPVDLEFPFIHGSRGFMHLGHQVYILGFESQDAESARPLAFACSLLLVLVIAVLNLAANLLRSRLR